MNTLSFVQSVIGSQRGFQPLNRFLGCLKDSLRVTRQGTRRLRDNQCSDIRTSEFLESRCLLSAAKPAISISDASIVEGDSGTSTVVAEVTLSEPSTLPITVRYATRNRTGWAGFDYQAKSGTLTIPAGEISGQLSFAVIGDLKDEQNESFYVSLSSPTNATILRSTAIVTIANNDPPPSITMSDVWVTEGDVASIRLWFSQPSAFPVTISAATLSGTAQANSDFVPFTGNIEIPASVKSYVVSLTTLPDTKDEPTERFSLSLNSATNATMAKTSVGINITDDDPPEITISDVMIDESDTGLSIFTAGVRLSSASTVPVTFSYQTQNITATARLDYLSSSGTLTFLPGRSYLSIRGSVLGDTLSELNETFGIKLLSPMNAIIAGAVGTITIRDNDPKPVVSIANAVTTEGESGSFVNVTLSKISGSPVTVDYEVRSFTATAGIDVNMPTATLVIPAGQLSAKIPIVTVEDNEDEPDEAFRVVLTNPVGLDLGRWASVVTIQDNDGTQLPLFDLSDMSYLGAFKVPSGQVGSATFSFASSGIAFNPLNNSLFLSSDSNVGVHVAEVAIPSTLQTSGRLSGMSTATVLQEFVDLGRLINVDTSGAAQAPRLNYENVNLGGLLVANGGLTGGLYTGYTSAEPETSTHTHFRADSLDLSSLTSESFAGLLDIRRNTSSLDGRIRGGYMTEVPAEWQPYIGSKYVTGAAAQNRIEFSSTGPALFGFDAVNPEDSSGNALLAYPHNHPLQWSDQPNAGPQVLFNGTTKIDGVTFVPGTRSIIFIGSNGLSDIGYGVGSLFNDSARPYSGFHSQNGNYSYQIWAYDIEDFMAVRHGVKSPWTLQPTSVVNFDLPTPEPAKYLGGTAFDASTGRLYISQKLAGDEATPVIHVYQLGRDSSGSGGGFQSLSNVAGNNAGNQTVVPKRDSSVVTFDSKFIGSKTSATIVTARPITNVSSAAKSTVSSSDAGKSPSFTTVGEPQAIDQLFTSLSLDLSALNGLF